MNTLVAKNLTKKFGDTQVLKGIDLDVYEGDVVAIIGPSGCGKSTFLRCVNCLEDPNGGTIMFQGEDLADMKVDIANDGPVTIVMDSRVLLGKA